VHLEALPIVFFWCVCLVRGHWVITYARGVGRKFQPWIWMVDNGWSQKGLPLFL